MSNRSWFFASQGKQQGPCPEVQLREFVGRGMVTAETLVWTEGMADWQKAGDIPGLLSGASRAPAFAHSGGALTSAGGPGGGQLSIDVGLWDLLGRGLKLRIGVRLGTAAPWVATNVYQWMISRLHVPDRAVRALRGNVDTSLRNFVAMALLTYIGL